MVAGPTETMVKGAGLALADSPLGRTIATTATDIWNDSCAVDELEYAISYGAVGATANPTIVADVWKADPKRWRGRVQALAQERPDATEIDLAWAIVEEMSLRAAPLLLPAFEASGGRQGPALDADRSHPVPLVRSDARPGRALRLAGTQHHRQVPRDLGRRSGHGGSDLPRRQRQRDGVVQRAPGRRGRRSRRARAPTAGGRGPAGRRHGPGDHGDDGPARGLAEGPDRARRDRRGPGGHPVVRRRRLQAHRGRVPGTRPAGSTARGGDPAPPALVGAHRWGRRADHAGRLAAPVQCLVGRGSAADGRPDRSGDPRRAAAAGSRISCAPTSPMG